MSKYAPKLADIPSLWSKVFIAQKTVSDRADDARHQLLVHYHDAIQGYLRAELRDDHAADKLCSNFAVRVLEVDPFLKRADPERGRFRDYLKAVLRRMIIDHYREVQRERKGRQELVPDGENEPAGREPDPAAKDDGFIACWRQELINQAWKALLATEHKTRQPVHALLRLSEEQPGLRSAELAEQLGTRLGRLFTAAGVRQLLHRGREQFGDLLIREVARSLQTTPEASVSADQVEQELIELGLLFSHCKAAVERYRAES